jgi:hypothetical protein
MICSLSLLSVFPRSSASRRKTASLLCAGESVLMNKGELVGTPKSPNVPHTHVSLPCPLVGLGRSFRRLMNTDSTFDFWWDHLMAGAETAVPGIVSFLDVINRNHV